MLESGTTIMLITLLSSGICILCMYSIYGNVIRHETTLHDLRHRVETLQNQKLLHEAEITGQIDAVVQDATELPESDVELLNTEPKPIQESQEEPSLMSSSTNAA